MGLKVYHRLLETVPTFKDTALYRCEISAHRGLSRRCTHLHTHGFAISFDNLFVKHYEEKEQKKNLNLAINFKEGYEILTKLKFRVCAHILVIHI